MPDSSSQIFASRQGGLLRPVSGKTLTSSKASTLLKDNPDIEKCFFVDCMVALPGQIFYSTQIPVCLWFSGENESTGKCLPVSELELALAA